MIVRAVRLLYPEDMPTTDRQYAETRARRLEEMGRCVMFVVPMGVGSLLIRSEGSLASDLFMVGMVLIVAGILCWHFRREARAAAAALASDDPAALRMVANAHRADRVLIIGFLAIFVLMAVLASLFA